MVGCDNQDVSIKFFYLGMRKVKYYYLNIFIYCVSQSQETVYSYVNYVILMLEYSPK